MVNEYVKDDIRYQVAGQDQGSSDDEYYDEPMVISDWCTYYSDDLHNMWWELGNYIGRNGAGAYMLNRCDFSDFCEFCYKQSNGIQYRPAVGK